MSFFKCEHPLANTNVTATLCKNDKFIHTGICYFIGFFYSLLLVFKSNTVLITCAFTQLFFWLIPTLQLLPLLPCPLNFPSIQSLSSISLLTHWTFQVRNAINALQELATTTNTVASNRFPFPLPAHSNPNIPRVRGNENDTPLPRSSSHPPEMFCWEDDTERERLVSMETQTDAPLEYIQQFVLENRQLVLSWLDSKVCVFRESEQKKKPPDWLMEPLPPPTLWNTQHHRFSAGDVTERTSQIFYQHLPSSKSLKFHPYSWIW